MFFKANKFVYIHHYFHEYFTICAAIFPSISRILYSLLVSIMSNQLQSSVDFAPSFIYTVVQMTKPGKITHTNIQYNM